QCEEPLAPRAPSFCPACDLPLLLLAGKYQLLEVLGQGGVGTVYLARHVGLDRDATRVVKVIRPEVLSLPGVVERFRREVQLTASLSLRDPHVVRVYDDFGVVEGLGGFYVMEHLRGRSLGQLLHKEGS